MYLADANQPQTDPLIVINKSWKHPTAAKQEIIQRDAVGNNSTWLACAPAWESILSAMKLVLKSLYIGTTTKMRYGLSEDGEQAKVYIYY